MPPHAQNQPANPTLDTEDDSIDRAIVDAIRRGEPQAWTRLVERYQDRLFAVCVRMVHDRELATDLAQDAFLKIIKGIDTYDGRAKLSTWMIRVTMNVCLSKLRSEKLRRHASLDAPDARETTGRGPGSAATSARLSSRGERLEQDREPGPTSSVEDHEDRERVLAALRLLDPEQRAVLILCDARGNSYEDIADTLGIAVGTVKSRLFRARAALREAVEGTKGPRDRGTK